MRCYTLQDDKILCGIETKGYPTQEVLPQVMLECGIHYITPGGSGIGEQLAEMIKQRDPSALMYGIAFLSKPNKPSKLFPASAFILDVSSFSVESITEAGDKGLRFAFNDERTLILFHKDCCVLQSGDKYVINPNGYPEFIDDISDRKLKYQQEMQRQRCANGNSIIQI